MNYDAFMEPVSWFLTGMEKHSDEFREDLLGNGEAFIGAMRTHMAEAISGAAGEFDHELVQPAANVVPSAGQLLTYGGVTWV